MSQQANAPENEWEEEPGIRREKRHVDNDQQDVDQHE